MCVIVAKYIKGGQIRSVDGKDKTKNSKSDKNVDYEEDSIGWIGMKNRDRNYKPTINICQNKYNGVEKLYIEDSVTLYAEGLNEFGVCILNAALNVTDDESAAAQARTHKKNEEIQKHQYKDPDGIKIRRALNYQTPRDAAKSLIEDKMIGHTLIFNSKECYLLEGGRSKENYDYHYAETQKDPQHIWSTINDADFEYEYTLTKIDKDDFVVRTNHGHFMPWTGYQKNDSDETEAFSRKSSENRHNVVIENLKKSDSVDDIIQAMSDLSNEDSQLNPVRLGDFQSRKKLKTTGQICLIPKLKELIYIPVWSFVDATNFNKANSPKSETYYSIRAFNYNNAITEGKISEFEGYMLKESVKINE